MTCLLRLQFSELSETDVCSFRSLDAQNDGYTLVVGTNRCEIWAVANDIPESLVQVGEVDLKLASFVDQLFVCPFGIPAPPVVDAMSTLQCQL